MESQDHDGGLMRFVLSLVVLMGFVVVPVGAEGLPFPEQGDLELTFRLARQYEKNRTFTRAHRLYGTVSNQLITSFKQLDSETELEALPLLIAAVFRMGITGAKDMYANPYPLMTQMKQFERVQKTVDASLAIVTQLRQDYPDKVGRHLLENLYFVRAYNRLAWANKILAGIPWKNYIVYPPTYVIQMGDLAVQDLEQFLEFQGISVAAIQKRLDGRSDQRAEKEAYAEIFNVIQRRTLLLEDRSMDLQVHQISNFEPNVSVLSKIIAKRDFYQAYALVDYYRSEKVQDVLADAKHMLTLDDVLSKKNRRFFRVFDHCITLLNL